MYTVAIVEEGLEVFPAGLCVDGNRSQRWGGVTNRVAAAGVVIQAKDNDGGSQSG